MQIQVNLEELRKNKLFIATPMYGGQCHGSYTKAVSDLMVLCTKYGIEARLFFIFNESKLTADDGTRRICFLNFTLSNR